MMDLCTLTGLAFLAYFIVQCIRLVLADCDLQLQWAEKLGKSTGVLKRKVVWITGASSGIGEYLAYELAKAGCRLILTARRDHELQRVKKECVSYGSLLDEDTLVLPLDLLKFELHKPAVEEVLARFKQIDILVNNAGRSQRAFWEKIDIQVDRDMLELNVLAPVSLTRCVLPHMIDRKEGHIVTMSSIAGIIGAVGSASYTGAKHAIQGYYNGLRVEMYPKNIAVTNLCPGPTFSNLLKECYTETNNQMLDGEMKATDKRMSTARCARLCAVAIANKLDEAWITQAPVLQFTYIRQYMPVIFTWVHKRIGLKMELKLRDGN